MEQIKIRVELEARINRECNLHSMFVFWISAFIYSREWVLVESMLYHIPRILIPPQRSGLLRFENLALKRGAKSNSHRTGGNLFIRIPLFLLAVERFPAGTTCFHLSLPRENHGRFPEIYSILITDRSTGESLANIYLMCLSEYFSIFSSSLEIFDATWGTYPAGKVKRPPLPDEDQRTPPER